MEKPDSEFAAIYHFGGTKIRVDTSLAAKTPEDRERAINILKKALFDILDDEALAKLKNREFE